MIKTKVKKIEIISDSMTGNLMNNYFQGKTDYEYCYKTFNQFKEEMHSPDKRDTIILVDMSLPMIHICLEQECFKKNILSNYFSSVAYKMKQESNLELLAVQAGFKGIFYETEELEVFLEEIYYIADGGIRLPKNLLFEALHVGVLAKQEEFVIPSIDEKRINSTGLTRREVEILLLIQRGLANKEISDKLFVSLYTVKKHLTNIYQKIECRNRKEAVQWLMTNNTP